MQKRNDLVKVATNNLAKAINVHELEAAHQVMLVIFILLFEMKVENSNTLITLDLDGFFYCGLPL